MRSVLIQMFSICFTGIIVECEVHEQRPLARPPSVRNTQLHAERALLASRHRHKHARERAQARHPPLARARTPSISCGGATSFIGDVGQVGSSWLVYFGLTFSPPRLSGQFWTVYVRVTDSPVFKWIDEELNEGDNAAGRRRRRRPWRRPLQKDGSHCRGARRSFRSR